MNTDRKQHGNNHLFILSFIHYPSLSLIQDRCGTHTGPTHQTP